MILGFNKSPGAYIDTKYPENIVDELNIKTSDLMNIYALHRMRNMEPNFIKMKIKNINMASFYSGFSPKHYVGKPNFTITVFLSDNDKLPDDFEGMIRRIAHELLPKKRDKNFAKNLAKNYNLLKDYKIQSFWKEHIKGEGSKIRTISAEEYYKDESKPISPAKPSQMAINVKESRLGDQFIKYERAEYKLRIEELSLSIREKDEKIRELTEKLTKKVSSEHAEEVQVLKQQLDEKNIKLDEWSLKLADYAEKNAILLETVRKLIEMSNQQTEEMERQGQQIIELKKTLNEKESIIDKSSILLDDVLFDGEEMGEEFYDNTEKSLIYHKMEERNKELDARIKELEVKNKELETKNKELNIKLKEQSYGVLDNVVFDIEGTGEPDSVLKQENQEQEQPNQELDENSKLLGQKNKELSEKIRELNGKNEEIDKLNQEILKVKEQNITHLDSIADLKIKLKNLIEKTEKDSASEKAISTEMMNQIFEYRKDIKILRRERDHYKKIVTDKNLL